MKKVLIISTAFVLFFAALGYFIWWQHRSNQTTIQPAQTTSQPLPPASPDTGVVTQPDFNFARLSGDSLHLYSLPVKSDSTLEAAVHKDELDYDYIRVIAEKGSWYQNEDSLWILNSEVTSYYAQYSPYDNIPYSVITNLTGYGFVPPNEILNIYSKTAHAPLNTLKYNFINDSFLSNPPKTIKTKYPITIIGRLREGYSSENNYHCEILKVIAFKDSLDSIIGWAKSEDLIMVDSLEALQNKKIFSGTVGFIYHEMSGDWQSIEHSYLKTNKGFAILGSIDEHSFSPDKSYLFTDTKIVDSLGNLIVKFDNYYCNPTWVDNVLYVRGYVEDDGVYKVNPKNKTINKFTELPEQFSHFSTIPPEGDYYTKWPAVSVDNVNKVLTILYEREDRNNNQFRFKVRTNYNGKIISVDTTRIYSNEYN